MEKKRDRQAEDIYSITNIRIEIYIVKKKYREKMKISHVTFPFARPNPSHRYTHPPFVEGKEAGKVTCVKCRNSGVVMTGAGNIIVVVMVMIMADSL